MPRSRGETPKAPRSSSRKIQRWIDLLAALLVRRYPATFDQLARDVPAYVEPGKSIATVMRMFERDKDELRAFGVPIETVVVESDEGPRGAYRLNRRDFYLPYLCATTADRAARPRSTRIDRYGYQALATLAFEPDELAAVAEAAARARALGDPLLTADTDSAVRKLAVDLPLVGGDNGVRVLPSRPHVEAGVYEALSNALSRRKTVSFTYHAMSHDTTARRTVEPYGLFFLSAHWYLVGRDVERGELRNFRLSRIADPEVNAARSQTADFDIPDDFSLREHAQSRHAWELGDGDAVDVVVEFRRETGAAAAAARLGAPVAGEARLGASVLEGTTLRSFKVRRVDAFSRWLLSFAGDAVPVAPPTLVSEYRDYVNRTLALYDTPGAEARALRDSTGEA